MSEHTPDPQPTTDATAFTWPQALTLAERSTAAGGPVDVDAELAQRRYQRWRDEYAYLDDATLAAYLEAEGLTPDSLAALLGETPAGLASRLPAPLPWVDDLLAAYEAEPTGEPLATRGFLALVKPLITWGRERLQQRLAALPVLHQTALAAAGAALVDALTHQLPPLIERTAVLELHVARLQNQLSGDTPEARFASFTARLQDRRIALALLAEYPVLARQLATKVRQTTVALAEVVERCAADAAALRSHFGVTAALTHLELGAGDTHRDGRSVAILHFDGGQRLVYKPRSLAVDDHFQALLTWLNSRGADPALRTLAVLDRDDYGWVEFVSPAPCETAEQVTRFYTRQGAYLALLHVLSAADFHFENLIAAGEDPMLIDLEALFHPDVVAYDPTHPGQLAQAAMDRSVLSIGMLPRRLRFHEGAAVVDISGIGAEERQLTPDKLPVWEGAGTDAMHLARRHVEFSSTGHRAELAGERIDLSSQAVAVARGFEQMYRLLWRERAALAAPDGPLARFAQAEIRVVARATRTYSLLLQESSHPDLLRSALERDRLYARLWRDVADAPELVRLLPLERRDLHNGDVPIFRAVPGERHLWDSRDQRIDDYLPESGMARVKRQIDTLGDEDLERQLWYIRASFATLDGANRHAPQDVAPGETQPSAPLATPDTGPGAWIAAARALGDRLAALAHENAGHAVWIGLGLDGHNTWSLSPLTMHLYDGHAGLALFLAYLGEITAEPRYTRLAQGALATARVQAEPLTEGFPYVGGFTGWGGLIYTLTHLGKLWAQPGLWTLATEWAELAALRVDEDEQLDIIGGSAGCIGAVAALHHATRDPRLLAVVDRCAAHLAAAAQPMAAGVGWVVPNMGGRPLAGFSHGASGIGWALDLAAGLCDNPAYAATAAAARRYEASLFDAQAQNWRDLRREDDAADDSAEAADDSADAADDDPAEAPANMWAWCHGAPGIGLSRLDRLAHTDDPGLRSELTADIRAALASTVASGFGHGHSLCHGDMGNLELLVAASAVLDEPAHLTKARALAAAVLAQGTARGWVCGVPGGVETPGLMVGLAGIGYQFLRLADPQRIPSLLLMEPPR